MNEPANKASTMLTTTKNITIAIILFSNFLFLNIAVDKIITQVPLFGSSHLNTSLPVADAGTQVYL